MDYRTYLAVERRGRLNPGHKGIKEEDCPACQAPVPPVEVPQKVVKTRNKKEKYRLTTDEIVLLAAEKVSVSSQGVVPLSSLLIAVWKMSPGRFGLVGYKEQYPDSNKLLSYIDVVQCKDWLRLKDSHTWTIGAGGWKRIHELSKLTVRMPE
jgi:hypothetical protein